MSLRLFNVYGPRARTSGTYGAVFGVFLAQKLAKKPFTVVGDGNQTRDFTFIDDVVDAFVEMLSENIKNEIFNVGSGQTYSVNTLLNYWAIIKLCIFQKDLENQIVHLLIFQKF